MNTDKASGQIMRQAHSHTLLLRTILDTSPAAVRQAWQQWLETVKEPVAHLRRDTAGLRRLLPLLLVSVRRNSLTADSVFLTVLKSAYFREELRYRTYCRLLTQVLSVLSAGDIEAILINGAALVHSVFPEPMLRHCHNIDLYCNVCDVELAAESLVKLGYLEFSRKPGYICLQHDSGLQVELHRQLLGADDAPALFAAAYKSSQLLEVDDKPVRILAPEDALLQICAHNINDGIEFHPGLVCDAWMQISRGPELDPDRLREKANEKGLVNAVDTMLIYLSHELGFSVPDHLIAKKATPDMSANRSV